MGCCEIQNKNCKLKIGRVIIAQMANSEDTEEQSDLCPDLSVQNLNPV